LANINNDNILVSIADLKAKEKKAFENLYDKYSGALFNIILRIVNSNEIAEDVLQESFVKIWKILIVMMMPRQLFYLDAEHQ